MILFLISKNLSILEFYKNWGYALILQIKGLNKMKKFLKNLGVLILVITMVFVVVYMLMIAADTEYEINQEKERVYFEKLKEMQ